MKKISKLKLFQLLFIIFLFLPLFKGGNSREAISIIGIGFDFLGGFKDVYGSKMSFQFKQLIGLIPLITSIILIVINFINKKSLNILAVLFTLVTVILISMANIKLIGLEGFLYSFDVILKIAIGLYFFHFIKSKQNITKILGIFISILVLNAIFIDYYTNFIHQFIIQTLYILVIISAINIIYNKFGNKLINKKYIELIQKYNKLNIVLDKILYK